MGADFLSNDPHDHCPTAAWYRTGCPTPWSWQDPQGVRHRWGMRCPIDAKNNLASMEGLLADRIWSTVSRHEANAGLGRGEPDLTVAQRVIKQLYEEGKAEQAHALECIVCHGNWTASRANPKCPGKATCNRCGKQQDALLHTYYICEDNGYFKTPCVVSTQHLVEQAVVEAGAKVAFWLGCVLPRSNAARRPIKVSRLECDFVIDGPLVECTLPVVLGWTVHEARWGRPRSAAWVLEEPQCLSTLTRSTACFARP